MTEAQRVARGQRAEREWNELDSAFAKVREAILVELVGTSPSQPEKVLKLHAAVQNLTAVEKALKMVIEDGQVAAHALAVTGLVRPN